MASFYFRPPHADPNHYAGPGPASWPASEKRQQERSWELGVGEKWQLGTVKITRFLL